MAEYSIMIRPFELKPGISDVTGDELTKELTIGLGKLLQDVQKARETLPGGPGWEIINHQLTRINRHLVASFLLRRG